MSDAPTIEALVRGRFVPVPGATATRIHANAWTVRIPRTPEAARALRLREVSLDTLEDLVLALDEAESMQAVPSAEDPDAIEISVLL